jgi:hypothetical protein
VYAGVPLNRHPSTMLVFRTALVGCLSLLFTFVRSQTLDAAGEAPHTRRYFYVGGGYVDTPDGKVFQNQMYVERLSPASGPKRQFPIVFLHGGGQSGTVRQDTPFSVPFLPCKKIHIRLTVV